MATAITFDDQSLTAAVLLYLKDPSLMREVTYPVYEHALAAKGMVSGGEYMIPRWKVNRHTNPTQLFSGYEPVNNDGQQVYKPGVQLPTFLAQPILISMIDDAKYGGEGSMLDILKDRTQVVQEHIKSEEQLATLSGPAASGTFGGVQERVGFIPWNGTDNTTGFLEAAVTGTNTIHGVTKASYPATSHPRFHNYWRDVASQAGVNLLNALNGATVELQRRDGPMRSSEYKFYCGVNPGEFMKRVLRPLERYEQVKKLDDAMRMALVFNGAEMHPVAEMPTTGASTASQRYSIIGMNLARSVKRMCYPNFVGGLGVKFASVPGSPNVRIGLMTIGGNNIGDMVGLSILLTNAETF